MKERDISPLRENIVNFDSASSTRRFWGNLIGRAPSKEDREELRRYELGSNGRTRENVLKAIVFTRKFRKNFKGMVSILENEKASGFLDGKNTLPVIIEKGSEPHNLLLDLFDVNDPKLKRIKKEFEKVNGVAFSTERKFILDIKEDADRLENITIMAMDGFDVVDKRVMSRENIDQLNNYQQEALEKISEMVKENAFNYYAESIPEMTD